MRSAPHSLFGSLQHRAGDPETDGRFLSRAACRTLVDRIIALTTQGGYTRVDISSAWANNVRWARNVIATGGETQQANIEITRRIEGASGWSSINTIRDDALHACVRRAEYMVRMGPESPDTYPDPLPTVHPHTRPKLWFDGTANDSDTARAGAVDRMIAPTAAQSGLLSAGYFEIAARGRALITSDGLLRYYPYTTAQCSVTVRDTKGRGSGWAGVDWNDVGRIDTAELARIALDKCQRSRGPVAVEPGRFTAILEPQAVCDLVAPIADLALDRRRAEDGQGPFADPTRPGYSRIGQQVIDTRFTFGADPMDPDCGFVPFDGQGEPFTAVNWIEKGVLRHLAYDRYYGLKEMGIDAALPNSAAFRLDGGGTATLAEMIASTVRGVLVTRFNNVRLLNFDSMLMNGNTRDGFWLIEHGEIRKPITNFRFTESPMFMLNNIEAIGAPQRVFRPDAPAVVPPLMVRDFSFTGLVDAF